RRRVERHQTGARNGCPHQAARFHRDQFTTALETFTTRAHLATSERMKAANCVGVLPTICIAFDVSFCANSGSLITRTTASCSVPTMIGDVRAGSTRPYHALLS